MPGDHLVEKLYPEGSVLKNKSVLSFTPALCASMQVSLCVKLLTGRRLPPGSHRESARILRDREQ